VECHAFASENDCVSLYAGMMMMMMMMTTRSPPHSPPMTIMMMVMMMMMMMMHTCWGGDWETELRGICFLYIFYTITKHPVFQLHDDDDDDDDDHDLLNVGRDAEAGVGNEGAVGCAGEDTDVERVDLAGGDVGLHDDDDDDDDDVYVDEDELQV